ncbi:MAG: hypothetical protein QMB03_10700, partial [Spirosomataceae bacterium]
NIGEQFSSKYFRTWVSYRTAIEAYPEALEIHEESPRKKFSNIVLKLVAEVFGNTPPLPAVTTFTQKHISLLKTAAFRNLRMMTTVCTTIN